MSDAASPAKFGWSERWKRAGRVFLLGLVSVWLVQTECVAFSFVHADLLSSDAHLETSVAELTKFLIDPFFWFLYALFGLPVALLHSALSLLWTPSVRIARTQAGMTFIACVAMGSAAFANPLEAYALTVIVLILSHAHRPSGPRTPRQPATKARSGLWWTA